MNSDFIWTLQPVVEAISKRTLEERAKRHFIHPHESIWPADHGQFTIIADEIYNNLSSVHRSLFLSVCLACHLLNQDKSPQQFSAWLQSKTAVDELLGLDLSFEEIASWSWGRVAIPGVDLIEKWNDKVIYAMVGSCQRHSGNNLLMPAWADNCLNGEARHSVQVAADLLAGKYPESKLVFWPMLDPEQSSVSINGPSLGLPVYLSFLSVAGNKLPLPEILATGALGTEGELLEVGGLEEKFALANRKGFASFIYPLLPGVKPLESSYQVKTQGVSTIDQATEAWFGECTQENARLMKLLMPVPFENDIRRLSEGFVGRGAILKEIDHWANDPAGNKIFWITGSPGMGKSALAAKIASDNPWIIATHFCDFFNKAKHDPAKMICSIAYQMAASLPEYAARLDKIPIEEHLQKYREAYTLFENLIVHPLEKDFPAPATSQVILIDALDEASRDSSNEIAFLLTQAAQKTPPWLRFLLTSRPEPEIISQFHSIPLHGVNTSSFENREDIAAYIRNHLAGITDPQLETILEKSDGNFLYVRHVCAEIQNRNIDLEHSDEFPKGLNAVYYRQFGRQFGKSPERYKQEVRPLLCLIASAAEPLSLDLLKQVLGIRNKMELNDLLDQLGTLFPRRKSGSGADTCELIIPWHLSVIDWLSSREYSGPYFIDIEFGHSLLADFGWGQYQKLGDRIHPYFRTWLPKHLFASNRTSEAVEILKAVLRCNQIIVDFELDLHGLPKDEALVGLHSFINVAYKRQEHAVIIITGRGKHSHEEGALKKAVEKWLRETGKEMIVGFIPKGDCAIEVYFKPG